jgi:hypothetical protein
LTLVAQLLVIHRRDINMDVDAVEQRPGDLGDITLDHGLRAMTFARLVVEEPARTRIHGRGEHEARRKCQRHSGTCNRDVSVFQGLAHNFQNVARKFGKLIQEKNAVVRERDFSWTRHHAAAD